MSLFHRRQLLANLLAAPVGACGAANLLAAAQIIPSLSDLSPGVVIAWEGNTGSDSHIDLWSARVSDGDLSVLPLGVHRVILWDDVFLHKSVHQTVAAIRRAIPKYYEFDCRAEPNGSSFQLTGMNSLREAIAGVFKIGARARLALVDLDSCGVTPLDWLQVIPCLRFHYDMIGGVACGRDDSFDAAAPTAKARFCPSSIAALRMCDFGILVSDGAPHGHWQSKSGFVLESLSERERRIIADVVRGCFYFS